AAIATRRLRRPAWQAPSAEPLRIVAGPDARGCPELDEAFWDSRSFRVGARSDRMGLRLEGAPVAGSAAAERLPAPALPGAIQVAGDQLIVLGVACGTMGGYPHLGTVISCDLDRLGQLKPGDVIRFRLITLDQARRLDHDARAEQRALTQRLILAAGCE